MLTKITYIEDRLVKCSSCGAQFDPEFCTANTTHEDKCPTCRRLSATIERGTDEIKRKLMSIDNLSQAELLTINVKEIIDKALVLWNIK